MKIRNRLFPFSFNGLFHEFLMINLEINDVLIEFISVIFITPVLEGDGISHGSCDMGRMNFKKRSSLNFLINFATVHQNKIVSAKLYVQNMLLGEA